MAFKSIRHGAPVGSFMYIIKGFSVTWMDRDSKWDVVGHLKRGFVTESCIYEFDFPIMTIIMMRRSARSLNAQIYSTLIM